MVKQKMLGQLADAIKDIKHPLVPRSVVHMGGNGHAEGNGSSDNLLTQMLTLMLTDKLGLTDTGAEQDADDMGPEAKAYLKKIMATMSSESAEKAPV